jgi:hypothetical protein
MKGNKTSRKIKVFIFSLRSPGNGFIEGTELDGFLREFVSSANPTEVNAEVSYCCITQKRLFYV